mmetsp:Transcript_8575/g.19240  ORF Transcript_8575/g.19240 Transcript_8575/m.19240 type:complete len:647 (+) Transcript_8575:123-2063(+)
MSQLRRRWARMQGKEGQEDIGVVDGRSGRIGMRGGSRLPCFALRLPTSVPRKPFALMMTLLVIVALYNMLTTRHFISQWTSPPSYNLTNTAVICSIVSNEEYYLDEWLDYNIIGIGFTHIYIYDNTNDFELGHGWLERRTSPHIASSVTIQHYPGQGKQWTAYRDCARQVLKDGHRWIFYTDADEFLVLKKHDNVSSFLLEHDTNRMALSINWQVHSWNYEMQFRPQPVTKRFNGKQVWHDTNYHVKTISNVDKIDLAVKHHAHYATLKEGNYAIDTNGEKVSDKWMNRRYPSDVALVYHHNVKSWKEYIGKRTRGRATMTGQDLTDSVTLLIAEARQGKELRNTSEIDSNAWEVLKRTNPKYQFFDSGSGVTYGMNASEGGFSNDVSVSIGICCHVKDQEAYIDEWTDYHLALGFSTLYIYDSSDDFWMRQWGEQRNDTRLSLEHFPAVGNETELNNEKARAYAKCVRMHGREHEALAFMDVNDFFLSPNASSIKALGPLLLDKSACAIQFERKHFGHNGQFVYEPLPVTKRFTLRISLGYAAPSSLLLLKMTNSTEMTSDDFETLESDLTQFTNSGTFNSTACIAANPNTHEHIVHHYLRSVKECNKERSNTTLCNLKGGVKDQSAWEQMQYVVPWYANFNGMI